MMLPPSQLTDEALLAEVKRLARCEREATASLVAHMVEVEVRELFHTEACSSMFKYCTEVLRLSEHATFLRLRAARAVRRFPEILDDLAKGALNLSTIELLEPHLTAVNLRELLEASRHKSKREVEKLVRERFPLADVPATVRKLPRPIAVAPALAGQFVAVGGAEAPRSDAAPNAETPALASAQVVASNAASRGVRVAEVPPAPSVIAPLAAERYKVQFTASADLHDMLRRAQDLLRHRIPDGDLSQVFELALTMLVERLEKKKLAATDRPRASRGTAPGSRGIPAEVKRVVWKRDGGRCGFIGKNGKRCTETGFLEFHHLLPFAHGGPATSENIALRCRAHNQYEARLDFGAHAACAAPGVHRPWGDVIREASVGWG